MRPSGEYCRHSVTVWVIVTMLPQFKLLDNGDSFRISTVDELVGLGTKDL
jgi:hypothetical protein